VEIEIGHRHGLGHFREVDRTTARMDAGGGRYVSARYNRDLSLLYGSRGFALGPAARRVLSPAAGSPRPARRQLLIFGHLVGTDDLVVIRVEGCEECFGVAAKLKP